MNIKSFRKYLAIAAVVIALRQCDFCCGNEAEDDGICFQNNRTNVTNLNCTQMRCTNDSILLRICLNHCNNDSFKDIGLNLQNKAKWLKIKIFDIEFKIPEKPYKPIKNETHTSNESCLEFELSNISRLCNETSLDNSFQNYTLLCLKEIHDNAGGTSIQHSEQNNNIAIAIGLGVALPIIVISLIILTAYLIKLRSNKIIKNVKPMDVEKESSSPVTQSTDEATLCYDDLHFNNTNSTITNTETDVEIVNYYDNRNVVSYYPDSSRNNDGEANDETGTFEEDT